MVMMMERRGKAGDSEDHPVPKPRRPRGLVLTRLRELRDRRALTQLELATLAGVAERTVINAENGQRVEAKTARKIAHALKAKVSDLMEDTPPAGAGESTP